MMRNDYRRALILLRSNAAGCSGHVRLERRTLTGSMYFHLQAPEEYAGLHASLAGQDLNGSFACDLGEIRRDSRGQAALSYSFDPRSICGRELEKYRLVIISAGEGDGCEILLHGNIAGHAEVNWEGIRRAVCDLYRLETPPEAGQSACLPEEARAHETPGNAGGEEQDAPETDVRIPETEAQIPEAAPEEAVPEEEDGFAGALLGMDMNLPWPEGVEPLRPLFRLSVPMENPPDGEYVYIAAAMPPESGYDHCAVGVLVRDGVPVSVRYGLPAAWTAEPPAGLEEYSWVGDQNHGWWMTQVEPYN